MQCSPAFWAEVGGGGTVWWSLGKMPKSATGEADGCQIAQNEAEDAAHQSGANVAQSGQVVPRSENVGVFQRKGGQRGVAAA